MADNTLNVSICRQHYELIRSQNICNMDITREVNELASSLNISINTARDHPDSVMKVRAPCKYTGMVGDHILTVPIPTIFIYNHSEATRNAIYRRVIERVEQSGKVRKVLIRVVTAECPVCHAQYGNVRQCCGTNCQPIADNAWFIIDIRTDKDIKKEERDRDFVKSRMLND